MATAGGAEAEMSEELEALLKFSRSNKLDKVLATCDRILELDHENAIAQKSKCVCLARKGRLEEAKALALEIEGVAEAAYCAYRLGQPEEALGLLGDDDKSALADCVRAQSLYKLGDYDGAARCYAGLEKKPSSVVSNYLGALSFTDEENDVGSLAAGHDDGKHYEVLFNAACALLSRDKPAEAKKLLERIDAKMSVMDASLVSLQLAACDVALGLSESASARCRDLLESLPSKKDNKHRNVACCIANTIYASRKPGEDLFDSHKRLRPFAADAVRRGELLTARQRPVAALNWARLSLEMGKMNDAKEAAEFVLGSCGGSLRAQAVVLRAKCRRRGNAKSADADDGWLLEALREEEERKDDEIGEEALCRARAQCLVDAGDPVAAAKELEQFADENAVARACLLQAAGDLDGALAALGDSSDAAPHRLRLGDLEGAAQSSDVVHRGLALSWFDPDSAERIAVDYEYEAEDFDAEELLAEPITRSSAALFATAKEEQPSRKQLKHRRSAASVRRRRDKLKAAHLKKLEERGDMTTKPPDPERWLPKKLRSYNKRGRKNQRGKLSGAQGVDANFSKDVAKLDIAARKKEAAEKAAATPAAPNGTKKKGGKKGRR